MKKHVFIVIIVLIGLVLVFISTACGDKTTEQPQKKATEEISEPKEDSQETKDSASEESDGTESKEDDSKEKASEDDSDDIPEADEGGPVGCCMPDCLKASEKICTERAGGTWTAGECTSEECEVGCCHPPCVQVEKRKCKEAYGSASEWAKGNCEACKESVCPECKVGCCAPPCGQMPEWECKMNLIDAVWQEGSCKACEDTTCPVCKVGCCEPTRKQEMKYLCEMATGGPWQEGECPCCCVPFCGEMAPSECTMIGGDKCDKATCAEEDWCDRGCCVNYCYENLRTECEEPYGLGGKLIKDTTCDACQQTTCKECEIVCCEDFHIETTRAACEQLPGRAEPAPCSTPPTSNKKLKGTVTIDIVNGNNCNIQGDIGGTVVRDASITTNSISESINATVESSAYHDYNLAGAGTYSKSGNFKSEVYYDTRESCGWQALDSYSSKETSTIVTKNYSGQETGQVNLVVSEPASGGYNFNFGFQPVPSYQINETRKVSQTIVACPGALGDSFTNEDQYSSTSTGTAIITFSGSSLTGSQNFDRYSEPDSFGCDLSKETATITWNLQWIDGQLKVY